MLKKVDIAACMLASVMFVLLFINHFMFKAEARIGAKTGLTAREALGANYMILCLLTLVLLILVCLKGRHENGNALTGGISAVCGGLSVLFAGQAVNVVELSSAGGRVSMSIGVYLYFALAYLLLMKCSEHVKTRWKQVLIFIAAPVIILLSWKSGQLDGLSIMKEYASNQEDFHIYLTNHISMSFRVVCMGTLVGIPLGWFVYKHAKAGRFILTFLNTIESIPSLALICVMMFPLAFLSNTFPVLKRYGIAGVGAAPVFCALFCYALFHIVNSMYGALKVVDKQYIDTARGMGMTELQIFTKVELPLILPVLISGIRVSLIASILGVTIGSYIGYGALGKFILQGLNGFAIDVVMLGTLPIMGLVFFFDFVLRQCKDLVELYRKSKGRVKL